MSERVLRATSAAGAYDVLIGAGLLDDLGRILDDAGLPGAIALVSDATVMGLFGDRVSAAIEGAGRRVTRFDFPPGEASKDWATAGSLLERFSESGIRRDDTVVALGGGVTGDLAGFCAATYMRGIALVQVPTTLLAQVDSSIGGKTGVDLPRGKNLAGAFWPPRAVVSDTTCLSSLPRSEWLCGLAEVAKSAILDGEAAMGALERDSRALLERDPVAVESALVMAAGLKVRIVSGDEREAGAREALNLGHTLGHAIEQVAGYGLVAHGQAIATGMRFAGRVAEQVLGTDPEWSDRQDRLLARLDLGYDGCAYEPASLLRAMRADKKARSGEVRLVMSTAPGQWDVRAVGEQVLIGELEALCGEQASANRGQR